MKVSQRLLVMAAAMACFSISSTHLLAGEYESFKVAIYTRAYEVEKMQDLHWLDSTWQVISSQLTVDKIYLETHRDLKIIPDATLEQAKNFFAERGIEVAGGITYTINESNNFETFSYSDPEHRALVQKIAEHTARHFDEFILDDFFFTSAKTDIEIATKGNRSWTDYRLDLMTEAGQDLVLGPARRVNPNVKVIIKYPNWYDHFQGLGFNLEQGPRIFDGIWTGTETRNPAGAQHLQNYLSYNIIRYFENLAPGRNGGGWVDCGGLEMSVDRYAEQLHLTALAKAREVALFAYHQLLDVRLNPAQRASWQDLPTSWRYDAMVAPFRAADGRKITPTTMARIADVVLHQTDLLTRQLGQPVGIRSWKRFHTRGEAFLQNFLGMIGLPMDMHPTLPVDQQVILLTAQAAGDPQLAQHIGQLLQEGRDVVITTGLLRLEPEQIARIAEVQCVGRTALVNDFGRHGQSEHDILIPQLQYYTNDSWEVVSAGKPLSGGVMGFPILHRALYSKGNLYVLTIPEDFGQLYDYPQEALREIRRVMSRDLDAYIDAPSKVSLFLYDNHTLVVENFRDEPVEISILMSPEHTLLSDLLSGQTLQGQVVSPDPRLRRRTPPETRFTLRLEPHSYRGFKY